MHLCFSVNEVRMRMAFYAIAVNMVAYLVREMHQSLPHAATHVNDWVGAAFILTILGAFLADAYLGRFLTIVIFTLIYSLVSVNYMHYYYYYYHYYYYWLNKLEIKDIKFRS
ncbi:putative proton-dependent oligopeptide transporter family, MFS transporter superfamily [Dioscorea sansibarensis]